MKLTALRVLVLLFSFFPVSSVFAGQSIKISPGNVEGMVFIKGGCFQMGDTFGDGKSNETPIHEVCVDDFYMGEHEVTVGAFREFVNSTGHRTEAETGKGCKYYTGKKWQWGKNQYWDAPGFSQKDNHPVTCVSWNDSREYISWKSRQEGMAYRFPTEAEWEYAARSGGKKVRFGTGKDTIGPDEANFFAIARFKESYSRAGVYRKKTTPVKSFSPNSLGLYDMAGNVWEWCVDWYGKNYYSNSPGNNPEGPSGGSYRVIRGGSWNFRPKNLRAATRLNSSPEVRFNYLGFRLARTH